MQFIKIVWLKNYYKKKGNGITEMYTRVLALILASKCLMYQEI